MCCKPPNVAILPTGGGEMPSSRMCNSVTASSNGGSSSPKLGAFGPGVQRRLMRFVASPLPRPSEIARWTFLPEIIIILTN